MKEAGAGDVGHRGSNLLPGVNHVHTERIHRVTPETGGREREEKKKTFVYFFLAFYIKIPPCDIL